MKLTRLAAALCAAAMLLCAGCSDAPAGESEDPAAQAHAQHRPGHGLTPPAQQLPGDPQQRHGDHQGEKAVLVGHAPGPLLPLVKGQVQDPFPEQHRRQHAGHRQSHQSPQHRLRRNPIHIEHLPVWLVSG